MDNSPPDPLRRNADLFERIEYLVRSAAFGNIEALNTRHTLENLMTQSDSFQAGLDRNTAATRAASTQSTAALGAVASEIADLATRSAELAKAIADLKANQPVSDAQLAQLNEDAQANEETAARLSQTVSDLTADDAAVEPTPEPTA